MNKIAKITQREMVDFVLAKHPEISKKPLGIGPQEIRRVQLLLTNGEMDRFMESKGFDSEHKTWILKGVPGEWALICGKAA